MLCKNDTCVLYCHCKLYGSTIHAVQDIVLSKVPQYILWSTYALRTSVVSLCSACRRECIYRSYHDHHCTSRLTHFEDGIIINGPTGSVTRKMPHTWMMNRTSTDSEGTRTQVQPTRVYAQVQVTRVYTKVQVTRRVFLFFFFSPLVLNAQSIAKDHIRAV